MLEPGLLIRMFRVRVPGPSRIIDDSTRDVSGWCSSLGLAWLGYARCAYGDGATIRWPAGRTCCCHRSGMIRSNVMVIRIHKVLNSTTLELSELALLVGHRIELIIREDTS